MFTVSVKTFDISLGYCLHFFCTYSKPQSWRKTWLGLFLNLTGVPSMPSLQRLYWVRNSQLDGVVKRARNSDLS